MTTLRQTLKKLPHYTSKLVMLVVLVFVVFSPFGQILTTPIAHAQLPSATTAAGVVDTVTTFSPVRAVAESFLQKTGLMATPTPTCSADPKTWDICISNIVYVFTVGLGSGLAFIGSYFFDMTIRLSLDSASYAIDFLSSGWTAARDLANMAFILILIYIAFIVMFQAETTGTIQMLAWVIFIALIINFSFFLTRVVVDTGNIFAVQFYNSINVPSLSYTADNAGTTGNTGCAAPNTYTGTVVTTAAGWLGAARDTKDLTCNIMNALKFQTLFSTASFNNFYNSNTGVSGWGTNLITLSFLYIAAGAMYFILAASFLAAGIKFMVRIIVLWFAIVASPFALVAKAIPNPKIKHYYDQWQHMLISHAFYPAVFLFVFFFVNEIMRNIGQNGSLIGSLFNMPGTSSATTVGQAFIIMAVNIANVGIKLGFVVTLLYIGMKAADYVGVMGATAAQKFTNWVSRAGTSAVFAPAGWAMRNTFGRGAYYASQSAALKKLGAGGGFARVGANLLRGGLGGVGKSSFDLRGTKTVRSGLGLVGIATNEPGGKGGFVQTYEDSVKKKVANASFYKATKEDQEREYQNILGGLEEKEQQHIAQLAQKQQAAQEDFDKYGARDGRDQRLKDANKELAEATKEHRKEAERRVGKNLSDTYAKSLITPNLQNAWGMGAGLFNKGLYSRAAYEAYGKLQGDKKEGSKLAAFLKVKAKDAPEGKHYNSTERDFAKNKLAAGDYEFEMGGKAWWTDEKGKEKQYKVIDFSADDKKAYLEGVKDPVNVNELHEERGPAQDEREHARSYNRDEVDRLLVGVAAGAAAAGNQQGGNQNQGGGQGNQGGGNQNQGGGRQTPPVRPTGRGPGTTAKANVNTPPQAQITTPPVPQGMGVTSAGNRTQTSRPTPLNQTPSTTPRPILSEAEKKLNEDMGRVIGRPPEDYTAQELHEIVKEARANLENLTRTNPSDTRIEQYKKEIEEVERLVKDYRERTFRTPASSREPGAGGLPPRRDSVWLRNIQAGLTERADRTKPTTPGGTQFTMVGETIDRSDEVRPTSPPPKPPLQITHQPEQQTPAKSASESSQQAYTDRTSEIIDAHQQPDGSYGAALPPSQQITHQPQKPTGTAVAVTSMGGKGWTPPEIKEAKGIEKKELQKMFKKEIGELKQELKKDLKEKTDKIESSLARNRIGVPPPLNKAAVEERRKAQDVSQRKEWLDKERQRMSGPIINSAPLSTTNPPPAPPPPPSTQPGGAEPTEDNKK